MFCQESGEKCQFCYLMYSSFLFVQQRTKLYAVQSKKKIESIKSEFASI